MIYAAIILFFVLSMSHPSSAGIHCNGGFSDGIQCNLFAIGCGGDPDYDDACYVMYQIGGIGSSHPAPSGYWSFDCIPSGSLSLCNNDPGQDDYYCCCYEERCNTKYFRDNCMAELNQTLALAELAKV